MPSSFNVFWTLFSPFSSKGLGTPQWKQEFIIRKKIRYQRKFATSIRGVDTPRREAFAFIISICVFELRRNFVNRRDWLGFASPSESSLSFSTANLVVICNADDASLSKEAFKIGTVINTLFQIFLLELLQIEAFLILWTNSNRCTDFVKQKGIRY